LEEDAQILSGALSSGDYSTIIRIVREAKNPSHLAEALCAPLALRGDAEVWKSLRPILDGKGGMLALLDALLPEEL
jgi:hypothetical protein